MAQSAVVGFGDERWRGEVPPWRRAHEELVRLAAKRAGLDFEEGRWLLRAERASAHLRLGYGSFREYAERLFGYGARLVQEKFRVAEALERLPLLSGELEQGKLSFSAVRELSRVATAATEQAWLEAVSGQSIREIEARVSGHQPGSLPEDAPDLRAKRHVLRLEVSGEVMATFREALAKVRREAGEALDDDAAVLLLCRQVLGGPRDDGRSSYQVALTVCEHCRRGMQQGRGELVAVSAEVVAMAECDGQSVGHVDGYVGDAHVGETHVGDAHAHVGETHVGDAHAHVGETHAHAHVGETHAHAHVGETHVHVGDAHAHAHVGDAHAHVGDAHAHVGDAHAHVGDAHAHVGDAHAHVHVGETHAHVDARVPRARQGIAPALRRRVMRRDSGRCRVPGCRHAVFVDVHHLDLRSEGGSNALENLVTLCAAHHRAIHRGELVVTGTPSRGLTFRHSEGTPYGASLSPQDVEVYAEAFRALTLMGYRETEVKRALRRCSDSGSTAALARVTDHPQVTLEKVIRLALRELASGVSSAMLR